MRMRFLSVVIGIVTCAALCMTAVAQDTPPTDSDSGRRGMQGGRQMPQLPPEKAKAAWQTQSARVATLLGVDKDNAAKLEAAYIAARESYIKEMRAAREDARSRVRGQDRDTAIAEEIRVMQETRDAERAKLEAMLKKFLAKEQVDKALPLLGAFDVQWDFIVDGLTTMQLEAGKQSQAMNHVDKYVLAMNDARATTDREAMRQKSVDARRQLNESMQALLTPAEMEEFQKAVNFGRQPGAGRGARGGEGADGPRRPRGGRGGGAGGANQPDTQPGDGSDPQGGDDAGENKSPDRR